MKKEATLNDVGVLGFTELWALGIGQVIGAGVITLVGPAIGLTGHSAWLAYFVAVVIGAMTNLPIIIFSSVTKYSGGDYSIITMLGARKSRRYVYRWILIANSRDVTVCNSSWNVFNLYVPSSQWQAYRHSLLNSILCTQFDGTRQYG